MSIAAGTRLGPYEIISRIGAGGMGEVWRARDTRLERDVAIKVLPSALAHDPQFRARFEREAKTISQLNHPHICQIYDVGEAAEDGSSYLVMELLEGESLADRLLRGALPLPEVIRYGAQIADALAAAHRAGIVHRDLKPGNVMLTKSGAKLLDFGLAKGTQAPVQFDTSGATEHKPLTAKGTILGTFQYMAPEQLEGDEADARTDIFAFGAVLYEMVTGKRAFEGKTKTSLIAAIVDRDPLPINSLQPLTPASLERVIAVCLAKSPDERWQSAQDVARELRWIGAGTSQERTGASMKGRSRYVFPLALCLLALLATTLGLALYRERLALTRANEKVSFQISAPADSSFGVTGAFISPDGRMIALIINQRAGGSSMWIRELKYAALRPLPGTEGATFPFWSPDSRQLGFFAGGKLKRIVVAGGAARVICDAPNGRGGTWSSEDVILFSASSLGALRRVPASGGIVIEVFPLDGTQNEESQRWPFFLPDGNHFLYSSREGSKPGIYLATLDGKTRHRLKEADTSAAFANGLLLYVDATTLFAQPLDVGKGQLSGDPVAVAEEVGHDLTSGRSTMSVSDRVLATRSSTRNDLQLVWLDRAGLVTATVGPMGSYDHPDASPDGKYIAVDRLEPEGSRDIWIVDSTRGNASRLTVDPATDWISSWSSDGRIVAYLSDREGLRKIFSKVTKGSQPARKLIETKTRERLYHWDWAADGQFIVIEQYGEKGRDLWRYELATGAGRAVVKSDFNENYPRISPDGRWLAYSSDLTGRSELYVLPLAGDSESSQVSTEGGTEARWRGDGRELFFLSKGNMMSVVIAAGGTFEGGLPQLLFEKKLDHEMHGFDVSADGKSFLALRISERAMASPVTVTMNWAAGIRK